MQKSKQNVLARNSPPRVVITYNREENGASIAYELACVVGVVADFTGVRSADFLPYADRDFISIDKSTFGDIFKKCAPSIQLDLQYQDINVSQLYTCQTIDDFHPDQILGNIPALASMLQDRKQFQELLIKLKNNSRIAHAFPKYINEKNIALSFLNDDQINELKGLFEFAIGKGIDGVGAIAKCENAMLDLDNKLSAILDIILHNPAWQKIESTWRGLRYLIQNSEDLIKFRILNATYDEVFDDLDKALEVDRSYLFKNVYEKEYGTLGGSPYSFMLFDFYVGKSSQDVEFVRNLSGVMACAYCPACIGIAPSMFDLKSFTDFYVYDSMKTYFESAALAELRGYQDMEDSRYLAFLTLRWMGRIPYGPETFPIKLINYREAVPDHENFLWCNSIYIYASQLTSSFANYGWYSSVIGVENGGKISGLPVFQYIGIHGDKVVKCPTEIIITDRRENELSKAGFITPCYCKDQDYCVFFSSSSSQISKNYDDEIASASAILSAVFPHMVNVCRFAQYIHMILRNKIGSIMNADALSLYITKWISKYVSAQSALNQSIALKYPLRDAKVFVYDETVQSQDLATQLGDPQGPGTYRAIIYLTPYDFFKSISISMRLVKKAPKPIV